VPVLWWQGVFREEAQKTRVALVRCTKCNARSGRFQLEDYGKTSWSQEAEEAAVAAWNKRTNEGSTWLSKFTLTEEGDIL